MRQRLLDATVDCLVEHGWSGTSTTLVSQRAGVSRGAQLHHFPTKNDLVLAAVAHLSEMRGQELREAARAPADRQAAHPRRAGDVRRALHQPGVQRRARALGRCPHRRGAARGRRTPRAAGGSRGAPDRGRGPGCRREPAAGARAGAGDPRPGARARAGEHDQRRHRPAAPHPGRLGAHPRRGAGTHDRPARPGAGRPRGRGRRARGAGGRSTTQAGARRPRPPAGTSPPRSCTSPGPTRSPSLAATDKAAWDEVVLQAIADPEGFVDVEALAGAQAAPAEILARWRAARAGAAAGAARATPPGEKMPWFGPPMSPTSMATARFMETWAHSLDVVEALGRSSEPTDRIRHVAHLGVRTRNYAYSVHGARAAGRGVPDRAALRPRASCGSGARPTRSSRCAVRRTTSACGSPSAATATTSTSSRSGPDADQWLDIAQAFAGPSGAGA